MSGDELRWRLLASTGMTQASAELQDGFLYAFERITLRRLGCIVSGLPNVEQVGQVRLMRQSGMPDGEVLQWIKSHMRLSYDDLYEAVMLAVVQEVETTPVGR